METLSSLVRCLFRFDNSVWRVMAMRLRSLLEGFAEAPPPGVPRRVPIPLRVTHFGVALPSYEDSSYAIRCDLDRCVSPAPTNFPHPLKTLTSGRKYHDRLRPVRSSRCPYISLYRSHISICCHRGRITINEK